MRLLLLALPLGALELYAEADWFKDYDNYSPRLHQLRYSLPLQDDLQLHMALEEPLLRLQRAGAGGISVIDRERPYDIALRLEALLDAAMAQHALRACQPDLDPQPALVTGPRVRAWLAPARQWRRWRTAAAATDLAAQFPAALSCTAT